MPKPEYWDSTTVAAYLKITMNNLRQITFRMTNDHEKANCERFAKKCNHMIVDHIGLGKAHYDSDDVIAYSLVRKGEISPVNMKAKTARRQRAEFD